MTLLEKRKHIIELVKKDKEYNYIYDMFDFVPYLIADNGIYVVFSLAQNQRNILFKSKYFSIPLTYSLVYHNRFYTGVKKVDKIDPVIKFNYTSVIEPKDCALFDENNNEVKADKKTIKQIMNILKYKFKEIHKEILSKTDVSLLVNLSELNEMLLQKYNHNQEQEKIKQNEKFDKLVKEFNLDSKKTVKCQKNEVFVVFENDIEDKETIEKLLNSYDSNSWAIDNGTDRRMTESKNSEILLELSVYGVFNIYYFTPYSNNYTNFKVELRNE